MRSNIVALIESRSSRPAEPAASTAVINASSRSPTLQIVLAAASVSIAAALARELGDTAKPTPLWLVARPTLSIVPTRPVRNARIALASNPGARLIVVPIAPVPVLKAITAASRATLDA